jgi:hypothetical protein
MPEINVPACPVHGTFPRALHEESFEGAVQVLEELIATVSGVGTTTYTRCPYGYEANFNGLVRALEDLNASISGIQGGGGGSSLIVGQGGTTVTTSGSYYVISSVSGPFIGSGLPSSPDYGSLWYKQDQGRLLVYASGGGTTPYSWYQTNAEPLIYKSELPPSGTGHNAPLRDGFVWFNTTLANILVFDETSSSWYESAPRRDLPFRAIAPTAAVEGEAYFDSTLEVIKVWNGTEWVSNASSSLPSVTTTFTSPVSLDSYSASSTGTRTYTINVDRGGEIQTSDVKVIHTATDAYLSEFAIVYSSGFLASFSGQVSGGVVSLQAYSNTADSTTFRPVRVTP